MKNLIRSIALVLGVSQSAMAQECTGMWHYLLDTNPTHPKVISGDTHAAYAVFSFMGDPSKKYVFKGNFPHARFMSIEAAYTRWGLKDDGATLFDYQFEPDSGSMNPFQRGVRMDVAKRAYTFEAVPDNAQTDARNVIRLKETKLKQSMLFRIYAPNPGTVVKESDFPRVFAVDAKTNQPVACPANSELNLSLNLPQFLTMIVQRKEEIEFRDMDIPWGPNSAIPYYLGGADKMTAGADVAVFRFKAPSHVKTWGSEEFSDRGDVRYWSFCTSNLVKIITLNCVPDAFAKVDKDGWVTIVYGRGGDVKARAEAMGANFLEDTRDATQKVGFFAYRNMFPKSEFQEQMYKGDYRPAGQLCLKADFLSGHCGE